MKNCENCKHFQSCYNWCKQHLIEIKQDPLKHKCSVWKEKSKA